MWARYLRSASNAGLLAADNDVLSRLRLLEGEHFRSAMAECTAAWLFADQLRLSVGAKPPGRNGKVLDLMTVIPGRDVCVEVKAPYRIRTQNAWAGDDADIIVKALSEANSQFDNTGPNILVIVPTVLPRFHHDRHAIIAALLGKPVIAMTINKRTGEAVGDPRSAFILDGRFTKLIRDGKAPGYTRVSAVITIEASPRETVHSLFKRPLWISYAITHNVLVVHNPFAMYPIAPPVFNRWPQIVRAGDVMQWTDRQSE